MLPPSVTAYVLQNVLTAVIIIAYLAYEIRLGRGHELFSTVESLTAVVLALASESENVDTDKALDELNGDDATYYRNDGD